LQPWDAVVLTADPEHVAFYDHQLARARLLGRFPACTAALALPARNAACIGSGAATLHVIASVVRHFISQVNSNSHHVSLITDIHLLRY
jgi:fucokinase